MPDERDRLIDLLLLVLTGVWVCSNKVESIIRNQASAHATECVEPIDVGCSKQS